MKSQRLSIKDVAHKANVSIATVSHVLNKTRFVSDEVTQRVMDALAETNYKSNNIAKALRQNKTHTIGVIIPDIINPFFSNLVNYIEMELNEYGYNIILCHSRDDLTREIESINKLNSWAVDGMIIAPASPDFDYSELKMDRPCPIVFADRRPNMKNYSGVFFDLHNIFQRATEELILAGHEKIGCILGTIRFSTTHDRVKGYREAIEKHGLPVREDYIIITETTVESGYHAIERLIKETDITAVIVANSRMSIGVIKYLNQQQIAIPESMAVIGFEAAEWGEIIQPPLTSIRETVGDMGVAIARLMLDILQNPEQEERQIQLEPYLTARSSY